jgi:outer membrane lipoprotein-sorting protein
MTPAAVLLLLAAPAWAAKAPKGAVAVSTAAAGVPFPAYAPSTAPITVELVAARFAEVDARIATLKSSFRQFVRVEGSDTVQTVEGEVLFRKPDSLRLTHRVPEPQTVVSDGTWLWVHRESTNQVIKSKLDAWRKSEPMAQGLLDFGKSADLLARYDAKVSTVSAPGPDGHRRFELSLLPKAEDRKKGAAFTLAIVSNDRDFFPHEAKLVVERASIRSIFENARLNPELPEASFRFVPPPGADLFESPEPKQP